MTDISAGEDCTLTSRQAEVLEVLEGFPNPPSLREVAAKLGIKSPNGVYCHLKALEKKGFVEYAHSGSRGLRVISGWWTSVELIAAMARWVCSDAPTTPNEYVIDLFVRPRFHASAWREFCAARPDLVEELSKTIRWRREC